MIYIYDLYICSTYMFYIYDPETGLTVAAIRIR